MHLFFCKYKKNERHFYISKLMFINIFTIINIIKKDTIHRILVYYQI